MGACTAAGSKGWRSRRPPTGSITTAASGTCSWTRCRDILRRKTHGRENPPPPADLQGDPAGSLRGVDEPGGAEGLVGTARLRDFHGGGGSAGRGKLPPRHAQAPGRRDLLSLGCV